MARIRAVTLYNFGAGKRTIRGRPNPDYKVYETVVAVPPSDVDRLLGVSKLSDRVKWLRKIRDAGWLVHNKGQLTNTIRAGRTPGRDQSRRAAKWYVFVAAGLRRVSSIEIDREQHPNRYRR